MGAFEQQQPCWGTLVKQLELKFSCSVNVIRTPEH